MKIKIDGYVSNERLIGALEDVAARLGDDFDGFYGVTLYPVAFDKNGQPIDALDKSGKHKEYCYPSLNRESPIPKRKKRKASCAPSQDINSLIYHPYATSGGRKLGYANEEIIKFTSDILDVCPDDFVDGLNQAIREAWEEVKPVRKHPVFKDTPAPMPSYFFDEHLGIEYEEGKVRTARIIYNPLFDGLKIRRCEFKRYWESPEWRAVEQRIVKVMSGFPGWDRLRRKITDAGLPGMNLPKFFELAIRGDFDLAA